MSRGWTAIDQASIVRASGTPLRSTMSPRGGISGLVAAAFGLRSVKTCSRASRTDDHEGDADEQQHHQHQPVVGEGKPPLRRLDRRACASDLRGERRHQSRVLLRASLAERARRPVGEEPARGATRRSGGGPGRRPRRRGAAFVAGGGAGRGGAAFVAGGGADRRGPALVADGGADALVARPGADLVAGDGANRPVGVVPGTLSGVARLRHAGRAGLDQQAGASHFGLAATTGATGAGAATARCGAGVADGLSPVSAEARRTSA